jgi:hypothetical protein
MSATSFPFTPLEASENVKNLIFVCLPELLENKREGSGTAKVFTHVIVLEVFLLFPMTLA